ncbi:MAG: hypothetical protein ACI8TX_001101 [Hyphomicrobiaceae bacterium]|jgi:hypothetical protein
MISRDRWFGILLAFGFGNLATGVWMLADPQGWYLTLPAGIPDTGPLNEHFIRDLGSTFSVMGFACFAAAVQPRLRVPAIGAVTLFYVMHAGVHVTDTLAGRLPSSHWAIDFPGVYLPAIILAVVLALLWRSEPERV